ncbi:HigA family addiction module antitoxin [Stutzerimonas nitrititolerans]|uniref:HigA family addiction module antitoxin n=1 Tax=Stutzerimonas nitrititolerans TaxID=2482751 RepID=UPI00289F9D76|nr:HigA family addiction module antitoxin [Stutzerimonas nitrititolerans]
MPMHNPPHPGEALREDVLPALGMTEAEFAKHLEYPIERLAAVLRCCNPINTDLAQCLELAGLGKASLWLAEQAAHDLWQSQQPGQHF